MFALRTEHIGESATLALNTLIKARIQAGDFIINLTVGEPDGRPPEVAEKAILEALEKGLCKYTPVAGTMRLRESICRYYAPKKLEVTPAEVLVTVGAKQAIFNALQALVNPGDEVLIFKPFWLSYPPMVRLAGGSPVLLPLKADHQLDLDALAASIGPQTKCLILNSPSNPTGVVQKPETLIKLARLLEAHPHVWILSDEIYQEISLTEESLPCFAALAPALQKRIVTVNGLSKSAAMTGWRLGWSIAPPALTERMLRIQGQATSGASSLVQEAAAAVLAEWSQSTTWLEGLRTMYQKRALESYNALHGLPGLDVIQPSGAFYLWCITRENDTELLVKDLLNFAGVGVVPGAAFGDPRAIRISFALKNDALKDGLKRLQAFFRARYQSGD